MTESHFIDEATVRHMANLSRLALSDTEVARYTEQLSDILEYASHLPELSAATSEENLRLDNDAACSCDAPHKLLRNAVAVENGQVKVPAILDRSES